MKRMIMILIFSIITLSLCGCIDNNTSLTEGKWTVTIEGITITRQFNGDGTTSEWVNETIRSDGIYTIVGNEILATMTSITNEEAGESMDFPVEVNWRWSYSIKRNKLTLTDLELGDNEEVVYTRD